MRHYTKEDIIRLVREEDAQFIRMQFTDIFGQLKRSHHRLSDRAGAGQPDYDGWQLHRGIRPH